MKMLLPLVAAVIFALPSTLTGQDPFAQASDSSPQTGETPAAEKTAEQIRDEKLAAYLSGSKFVGRFTIIGKENGKMPAEEYTLRSVKKLPGGNIFLITARIKYGDKDIEVPMPIPIEWAGKTPMISLDDFTIPGMGTFSAKIVINKGRYAGTWSHDENGGHMFGVIEKEEPKTGEEPTPAEETQDK